MAGRIRKGLAGRLAREELTMRYSLLVALALVLARPANDLYGAAEHLSLFLHEKGHAIPPEAEEVIYAWLDHFLKLPVGT